jgi:epoxyqueuosine reductase QueG
VITAQRICEELRGFLAGHPGNRLEGGERIYDEPLVGVASADDPYFAQFKQPGIIGDIFKTPAEWLGGAASVISFFLPFSDAVKKSNRTSGIPSVEWLHGRFKGEALNNDAKRFVVTLLEREGCHALSPTLDPRFVQTQDFRSSWSERHVAFVTGLGTFGLSRGLITAKGIAGRFGSVVTDLQMLATPRPYEGPFEYCLALSGKADCQVCIDRCPAGAITAEGKAHPPCSNYLRVTDPLKEIREGFGYAYSACGKCQTAVPCESGIPFRAQSS